jgi:hypothetical protein
MSCNSFYYVINSSEKIGYAVLSGAPYDKPIALFILKKMKC